MKYKFDIKQNKYNKQWYYHIVASNGRIVDDGSEGYASRRNCIRAIETVFVKNGTKVMEAALNLVLAEREKKRK